MLKRKEILGGTKTQGWASSNHHLEYLAISFFLMDLKDFFIQISLLHKHKSCYWKKFQLRNISGIFFIYLLLIAKEKNMYSVSAIRFRYFTFTDPCINYFL